MTRLRRTVSGRLREARERKRMTGRDLAKRTGLLPSAISQFETARQLPSLPNLVILANALGVKTDYLLGRVER